MAVLIPAKSLDDFTQSSEKKVYDYLSKLKGNYYIFYSVRWVDFNYKRTWGKKIEGEADFVILHPNRGILILEVKGGTPSLKNGIWEYSEKSKGKKSNPQGPFVQASQSRYALLDKIEFVTKKRLRRDQFIHGDLVVFPECSFKGQIPPTNADPKIFANQDELENLEKKIEEAFDAWNRSNKKPHLSDLDMNDILRALSPELNPITLLRAEAKYYNLLSDQTVLKQNLILKCLSANNRLKVEGTSGSGKSFLALDFALRFASDGKSVLFLYSTKALGQWLWSNACLNPLSHNLTGDIEFIHFQRWGVDLIREIKQFFIDKFQKKSDQKELEQISLKAFPPGWNSKAKAKERPKYLNNAISFGIKHMSKETRIDAVIVDEAQDIPHDWWDAIDTLSNNQETSKYYVFYDPQQNIHGANNIPDFKHFARLNHNINFRNSKPIAQSAYNFLKLIQGHQHAPLVEFLPDLSSTTPPHYRIVKSTEKMLEATLDEARRYLKHFEPSEIVLIGPSAKGNSPLNQRLLVGETPSIGDVYLTDDPSEWLQMHNHIDGSVADNPKKYVLVTTPGRFKGLEAEVVIIYNLDEFKDFFKPSNLYVAWTRARNHLLFICKEGSVLNMIEKAGVKPLP